MNLYLGNIENVLMDVDTKAFSWQGGIKWLLVSEGVPDSLRMYTRETRSRFSTHAYYRSSILVLYACILEKLESGSLHTHTRETGF